MLEDILDHNRFLDEHNHPHFRKTPGAFEGLDLVDFSYQTRSVFSESLVGQFRLQDARCLIAGIGIIL